MSPDDMDKQRRRCEAENSGLPEECPCYVLGMQRGLAAGREQERSKASAMHRRAQQAEAAMKDARKQAQWEGYCMAKGGDIGERYLDKLRAEEREQGRAEERARWQAKWKELRDLVDLAQLAPRGGDHVDRALCGASALLREVPR